MDGEIRQLSPRTLDTRRDLVRKLTWWAGQEELAGVGKQELQRFLLYCGAPHPEGRWGNQHVTRPSCSRTVLSYFVNLKTLFSFLVAEGYLDSSPLDMVRPPICRRDQVKPFTPPQIRALLSATKTSPAPARNHALVLALLDTGMRASEIVGVRVEDVDFGGRSIWILGKGGKHRRVYFGNVCARALHHLTLHRAPGDPLFPAVAGPAAGKPLTRSGLLQIVHDLGVAAGISKVVRCSPHTFRHTFAVTFLRNGGNVFALRELLGHTSLAISQRYVALAMADIANQHKLYSPGDAIMR